MTAVRRFQPAPGTLKTGNRWPTGLATAVAMTAASVALAGSAPASKAPLTYPVGVMSRSGRPAAPTGVTAKAGIASVLASWTPVRDATGYTVIAAPGPASCDTSGLASSCLLGGTTDTAYRVAVIAHGPGGDSEASAPSQTVTALNQPIPATLAAFTPQTLTTSLGPISLTAPGQQVTIVGFGFAAFSTAKMIMFSRPIELGSVTTDATGSFSASVTIPADLDAGPHQIAAVGVDPHGDVHRMALPVTVTAPARRPAARPRVSVTVVGSKHGNAGPVTTGTSSRSRRERATKHPKQPKRPRPSVLHFDFSGEPGDSGRIRATGPAGQPAGR